MPSPNAHPRETRCCRTKQSKRIASAAARFLFMETYSCPRAFANRKTLHVAPPPRKAGKAPQHLCKNGIGGRGRAWHTYVGGFHGCLQAPRESLGIFSAARKHRAVVPRSPLTRTARRATLRNRGRVVEDVAASHSGGGFRTRRLLVLLVNPFDERRVDQRLTSNSAARCLLRKGINQPRRQIDADLLCTRCDRSPRLRMLDVEIIQNVFSRIETLEQIFSCCSGHSSSFPST